MVFFDERCSALVLNSFKYITFEVAMSVIVSCKNTKLMIKARCLLLVLGLAAYSLQGQDNGDITFDESSMKFGLHLSPNGYGLFYRNTAPSNKALSKVFDISFTSVKHYKEKSILNQRTVNTSPYTYGKINRLYALRPMFGVQKTMAEKRSKNSVGVNVFALAGPVLGFVKPNYVNIEIPDPNNPNNFVAVSVRYDPAVISPNIIIGNASFAKGINQTRLAAGLTFKSGVEFNWGYYSSNYHSIELGFLIDYFPGSPEIMYNIKNKTVYSSFYLSFAFGKNY